MTEGVLFRDSQAAVPVDRCPVCGSERYGLWGGCIRCERRGSFDIDGDQ